MFLRHLHATRPLLVLQVPPLHPEKKKNAEVTCHANQLFCCIIMVQILQPQGGERLGLEVSRGTSLTDEMDG